jgi:hypothetical protein
MTKFTMVVALTAPGTLFKAMKPPAEGVCPFGPTTTTTTAPPTTTSSTSTTAAPTTTTTSTSTTTTTMASPSGAFLDDAALSAG